MTGALSTEHLPQRERFAFWSDLVCEVFVQIECDSSQRSAFKGEMSYETFGSLRVTEARCDSIRGLRTRRQIAKGREDDFLLLIQRDGVTSISQAGRQTCVAPGFVALLDSARPYKLDMPQATSALWLQFPRQDLMARCRMSERTMGIPLPATSGMGAVFAGLALCLNSQKENVATADRPGVAAVLLDMLSLALAPVATAKTEIGSIEAMRRHQLRSVVMRHACDPELTPSRAASLGAMSVRHANRLLAADGTSLERLIWSKRLEMARLWLEDLARGHLTISQIAFAVGFSDMSHFSRAFRARYGMTPSELRRAASRR